MAKEFNFKKVLVFSPHPDDLDFGCAGTVAKLRGSADQCFVLLPKGGRWCTVLSQTARRGFTR